MKISLKKTCYLLLFVLGVNMAFTSCTNDLDVTPKDDDEFLSEDFFQNPDSYKQVLAKLYSGLYVGGNDGDGSADIGGIGGDFSSYLRLLFVTQELPTDESIIAWADGNLPSMNTQTWTPANEFLYGAFSRSFYEISLSNEFLRQTTDEKLSARGVSDALKAEIQYYRAEARFLRAFDYYQLMDLFGNVPITTEADPVGFFYPAQKSRAEVYAFLEGELTDLATKLVDSRQNEYGRVDKSAAKFLLAQVYLNAKVYIGADKNTEVITLCNDIIANSGYSFQSAIPYSYLFSADNDRNGAQNEVIFPVVSDGNLIRATGGGMSFIIHASIGGSMDAAALGMDGGWAGTRTRKEFVQSFPANLANDVRATFYKDGQALDITNISTFTDGYGVNKFINKNSDGSAAQRPDIPDTDFPMFRMADVYLMYAEATLRGGSGGDLGTAVTYVNAIRTRAHATPVANDASFNLDFILAERGRELFWECHRRTDLIRFEKFSGGSKLWQWKGGIKDGIATESFRDLMPIPSRAIQANPTLKQNTGY